MKADANSNTRLKKTSIWELHQKAGARLVPYAGYSMPVQYKGVIDEHRCVREHVGLFDVSHMGVARFSGPDALSLLNYAVTRNLEKLEPGKAGYALLCNENGGTIDDLIIYQEAPHLYWAVLNASNKEKDFAHLKKLASQRNANCELQDCFDSMSLLALQGPKSEEVLRRLGFKEEWQPAFSFLQSTLNEEIPVKIAFTGYTGEKGCEIFVENTHAARLWEAIIDAGSAEGIQPIGLAARDSLRTEMGYSLYGHELSEEINPIEAGLSWAVHLKKPVDFLGKEALTKIKENPQRKLICLENESKQAPRQDMPVIAGGKVVGKITSGSYAPSLGHAIGMALVEAQAEAPFEVEIRGKQVPFNLVNRPFYKKSV